MLEISIASIASGVVYFILTNGNYPTALMTPFLIYAVLSLIFVCLRPSPLTTITYFMLSFMLIPHSGTSLPGLGVYDPEYNIFLIAKCTTLITLCLSLLRNGFRFFGMEKIDRWIAGGFILALIVGLSFGLTDAFIFGLPSTFDIYARSDLSFDALIGSLTALTVFFLSTMLRRDPRFADRVFKLFSLMGTLLVVEYLYFQIFTGSPLAQWAVHNTGRFQSLVYLSYDDVGLIVPLALGGTFYSIWKGRNYLYWAQALLLYGVALGTYQKVSVVAPLIFALVFFSLYYHRVGTMLLIVLALLVVTTILQVTGATTDLFLYLAGNVRDLDDYSAETFFGRVGIWLRSADVIMYSFPFGVGSGMVRYFLSSQQVPALLDWVAQMNQTSYWAYWLYYHRDGATDTHNFVLKIIAEGGLFGTFALLMAVRKFVLALKYFRAHLQSEQVRIAFSTGTAMLAGIFFYSCLEASFSCQFIFLLLLSVVSPMNILREEEKEVLQPAAAYNLRLSPIREVA